MQRSMLTLLTLGFASLAGAALALYFYARPTYLRVAVVQGSVDERLMQEAARLQNRDRASVRFTLSPVNDAAAATRALDSGLADLSIVGSDQSLPANGKTVVIMRKNIILAVAPAGGKATSISDLSGKAVGILGDEASRTSYNRLVDTVLARHDLPPGAIRRVAVDIANVETMIRSQQIAAVIVAGPPGDGIVAGAVNAVAVAGGGEPVFVPVGHIPAIVQQSIAYEQFTLATGSFSGALARPPQDLEVLAYTVRLFASVNVRDSTVGVVARAMFSLKPRLAEANPAALRIHAPSTAKDAALPAHPGAAAYLDGEEQSFFDRFSEFFYLGAMVLSIVGSAAAAIAGHLTSDSKREYREIVGRLLEILRLARLADETAVVRLLQLEIDNIFAEFMSAAARGRHDEARISNVGLIAGQVHQALAERRTGIGGPAHTGTRTDYPQTRNES